MYVWMTVVKATYTRSKQGLHDIGQLEEQLFNVSHMLVNCFFKAELKCGLMSESYKHKFTELYLLAANFDVDLASTFFTLCILNFGAEVATGAIV